MNKKANSMRKLALSDEILLSVEKPARYIGGEYNSFQKNPEDYPITAAFCFPDVYEIGTANLGMEIIYNQLNDRNDTMCDRVYSPWLDLDKIMEEKDIPLFGVESQRPIKHFDWLMFTLSYEMFYTNVLRVLDLSKIPLLSKDRTEEDPLVLGGGACAYNPEPIADFFDAFDIGESEAVMDEIMDVYKACKKAHKSRLETLEALAEIEGVYVPAFYDVSYKEDGTIGAFKPNNVHAKEKIKRRVAADMEKEMAYPKHPIVPFSRGEMDRATLEVMRGCPRGCRFCQAGMIYRPVRRRSLEEMKKRAEEMLRSSGFEEINLSSLSTSDYKDLSPLLDAMLPFCSKEKINIGIPSLRIDSLSLDIMKKVQDVKKTSLTFAPEAGSQRMRDIINKGLTQEQILEGARAAFKGGWNRVKLYFMLGQPFEMDSDVEAIPALANEIAKVYYETIPKEERMGRVQVQISTSFFVPKPFTAFQWAPMCKKETFLEKAMLVKDTMKTMLNQKSLSYHYHDDKQTELEGLFARGDRRVAKTILAAYKKGCKYDAWNEYLDFDKWLEAMQETGVSFDFYNYRERSIDEILPWDFVDIGVTKNFLKNEWKKASEGVLTPNCFEKCSGCGAACFKGGVCLEHQN